MRERTPRRLLGRRASVLAAAACFCCRPAVGLDDGLAFTPPMGFNTWNSLACPDLYMKNVSLILQKLKDLRFDELGYKYFVIDDCWQWPRNKTTHELLADLTRFPSGMRNVSDQVHALGFKFGLYTDRGIHTCAGRPASQGHEPKDAATFASWNVDFVKNDGCGDHDCWAAPFHRGKPSVCDASGRRKALCKYERMYKALKDTGRDIVHALSGYQPWYAEAGPRMAHMWRVTEDVRDWRGVYLAARTMEQLVRYNGHNGWNDPDMLIGSSAKAKGVSLTQVQSRAQFSLWAVMGAPLMVGANMLELNDWDRETYTNRAAIRINQDPLGAAGTVAASSCSRYPSFHMGMSEDGKAYNFSIDTSLLDDSDRVHCGPHMAEECRLCSRTGGGSQDCQNHCAWDNTTGTCNPQPFPPEDKGVGWNYIMPNSMDCQQAWTKRLEDGDVGVALVNFARWSVSWRLQMKDLVPWVRTHATVMEDLWLGGGYTPLDDTFYATLAPNGGHILGRLSTGDAKTAAMLRGVLRA